MRKVLSVSVLLIFFVSGKAAGFDDAKTHPRLATLAIQYSTVNFYLAEVLGFPNHTATIVDNRPLIEWLTKGSTSEDDPICRATNHFHNPLRDWSESGMRDLPWFVNLWCSLGEYPPGSIKSSVTWATGYTTPLQPPPAAIDKVETGNQWNWDRAREYFYIFLTGRDFQQEVVAITEAQRKAYLASSFQALGQVVHLLQDKAVPAHVRDDFRSHLEWNGITLQTIFRPTEWVIERFEYVVKKNPGLVLNASAVKVDLLDPSLTKFWDTNQYDDGVDPDELNPNTLGLAEYTNINFPSKNTIFSENFLNDSDPSNDVYCHPYPRKTSMDISDYIQYTKLPESVTAEDGVPDIRFYISKISDGEQIDKFLAPTYFTRFVQTNPEYDDRVFYKTFKIDDECAKNYAEKLIPRAIGYSAALLDYFFRGTLEISAPDRFLYSVIDGSRNPQAFTLIRAKVKNTTPGEEMGPGTLVAVAKYKKRTDYQPDLSADPPSAESRQPDFSYSVSLPIGIQSLSSETATEFVFNFSYDPIPAGITDLYLQVIFKGTLGNERDEAIAVGMKDLNEPMHVVLWNSTDWFYLQGQLYTADEIKNNPELLARVPPGLNIDPYLKLEAGAAFWPSSELPPEYHAYIRVLPPIWGLPPGRFSRIIILTDLPIFYMYTSYHSDSPPVTYAIQFSINGAINQEDSAGEFHPAKIDSFRGEVAHLSFVIANAHPYDADVTKAAWPPAVNPNPVPISVYP